MKLNMLLGERLKSVRIAKGWTLGKLGELSGVHEKLIFKYERGSSLPSAENLRKLGQALEVSSDYFLYEHSQKTGIPTVRDPALYERFLILEELDAKDRAAVMNLLDAVIVRKKFNELAQTANHGTKAS